MRRLFFATIMVLGCGDDEAPSCPSLSSSDFVVESGWQAASYAPEPTMLGCYPYKVSESLTFGSFISMRTNATTQEQIDACETVLTSLNCGTYTGDAGSLTFRVSSADRATMDVSGKLNGVAVDGKCFFNPCQPGCLAAITLKTVSADQQKLCEIPSQVTQCLFPEEAHSITFGRAGADAVEVRLAGQTYVLARD